VGDKNFAIFVGDFVLAALRDGASDANGGDVATKEDGAGTMARGFDDGVEGFGAVKFAKKPVLVATEERRDVVVWPGGRANDLDAMRADADAEFFGGPGGQQNVLDSLFSEKDPVVLRGSRRDHMAVRGGGADCRSQSRITALRASAVASFRARARYGREVSHLFCSRYAIPRAYEAFGWLGFASSAVLNVEMHASGESLISFLAARRCA
jgi:hypothetical protein